MNSIPAQSLQIAPSLLGPRTSLAFLGHIKRSRRQTMSIVMVLISTSVFLTTWLQYTPPTPPTPLELLAATNLARSQAGVPSLKLNLKLQQAAMERADDMVNKKYFAHTSPEGLQPWDMISKHEYSYAFAGENLAINYLDTTSLLTAWLQSPEHKANLLNPRYDDIGVGIRSFQDHGKTYVVIVELYGAPKTLSMK